MVGRSLAQHSKMDAFPGQSNFVKSQAAGPVPQERVIVAKPGPPECLFQGRLWA